MNNNLYQTLVEESRDVATIIDADGMITWVSPAVEHTLGYDPDELIGDRAQEYQHPDDRDAVVDVFEQLQAEPDEPQTIETRFRCADGSWCWIEATMQNRFDDDAIGGILLTSRDITERKAREQEYRELAGEYQALLENATDAIFFLTVEQTDTGREFRFERLSPSYEEQTGLTTEKVQGKTPTEVFGEEAGSELAANYHRCVRAREPITYQEELSVETGAQFWQTNLAPVITDGVVTRLVGITRDVTERVRRERQLQSQNEQLEEFASVISHDLRNPLNVAQGRAELLAAEYDGKHIDEIVDALGRMEEIIADTLTLARQGQVVSEMAPVRLPDLVEACWQNVSTGDATVERIDDITIQGDRSRLRHIFENLFRNAIDHGGPDVTVRVGQIDENSFYVEDSGPGIPPDARESAFEPGHTSASGGTGFGLTIVRRIAEAHGWEVDITEGTDGGARFEFTGVEIR
jgi:PAS domain S-box-containing protein